jgi:hypothetical protein
MIAKKPSKVSKKPTPTGPTRKATAKKAVDPVADRVPTRERKVKNVEPKSLSLGLTEFTRNLKGYVERSAQEKIEVSFGGTIRHIRFRPAADYQDIVEEIPEECYITIAQLRKMPNSYRALALVGVEFVVSSGDYKVLMDRHDDFPPRVVVAHMDRIKRAARTAAQRLSDRRIRRTSVGMQEILEIVEAASSKNEEIARQNAEIASQNEKIISLLAEVSRKGILTQEQEAFLNRLKLAEDRKLAEERVNGRRTLYTEKDLERNEVGTN